MNTVQQVLIDKLLDYLDILIFKGEVKLNGEYTDYNIFKTLKEGNKLRKFIYLETVVGLVEEAQLVSNTGEILAIKPYSIQKKEDGLVLVFEFEIEVKEV